MNNNFLKILGVVILTVIGGWTCVSTFTATIRMIASLDCYYKDLIVTITLFYIVTKSIIWWAKQTKI